MSDKPFFKFDSASRNPNNSSVMDISPQDLAGNIDNVKIVDVRRPDEWVGEFGHIAEAQLITLDTLPMRASELPNNQTIVFVCRSGGRSAQAAAWAREQGFRNVYNMQGGMIAWTNSNLKSVNKNS